MVDVLRAENQLNVDLLASRDLQHKKEVIRLQRQIESKDSKFQEPSSKVKKLKAAHTNIVKGAARACNWMRSAELTALRAKNLARNRLKTVQKLSENLGWRWKRTRCPRPSPRRNSCARKLTTTVVVSHFRLPSRSIRGAWSPLAHPRNNVGGTSC